MAVLTKLQVATELNIDLGNVTDNVLAWAEKELEKRAGKHYTAGASVSKTFKLLENSNYLRLPHTNITSVSAIVYDGSTLDSDDYEVYTDEGLIKYASEFAKDVDVTVTYSYGADTPNDMEKAAFTLIVLKYLLFQNPGVFTNQKVTERIGDYSVTYDVQDLKANPEKIEERIRELLNLDTQDFFLV